MWGGELFVHPGQACLSPFGLEYLPAVFKSCIYQVTAPKERIFSFSWGQEGEGRMDPKPQMILESLQA